MRYLSTRGGGEPQRFSDILLEGLAPDGGLYVPEVVPRVNLSELGNKGYPDLAYAILQRFMDDLPDLRDLVDMTYAKAVFGSEDITPLTTLEPGLHLLGLSNGPTLAFKDLAMQFLGHAFESILDREGKTLNILGATSGDTGSAAEHAMRGKRGIQVFMLSPHGQMSAFQRAQMFSLQDPNIHNLAVKGNFDDCQDLVKSVNADASFKKRHRIGAVNSINWARVAAQVVYYFKGYLSVARGDREEVSFAVPSGQLRQHLRRLRRAPHGPADPQADPGDQRKRRARRILPHRDLPAAQGRRRDLEPVDGHLQGVEFRALRVRSDRQRMLRACRGLFSSGGEFDLSMIPRPGFVSGRSTHADRIATIRSVHEKYGVTIDPHTADGVKVGLQHREPGVPLICLETALPVKFAETIREALGREPARPAGFENLEKLPQRFEVIEPDAEAVKRYIAARAC